jgi:hypothetical protein
LENEKKLKKTPHENVHFDKEHFKSITKTNPTSLALLGEWLSLKGSTELGSA